MIHVALLEPEITPNTGNVARLCAGTGVQLHLIGPLGFRIDDKHLRRAGLDYWPSVPLHRHDSFDEFLAAWPGLRIFCVETERGPAFTRIRYRPDDCLLFGRESVGLPASVLARYADSTVHIPMPAGKVRSLNLSTAVGIAVYEALRQLYEW